MSEMTLTSLAILTVNWERGRDILESFVPLVADCIRKMDDQPVSLVELQERVHDDAGIKIPSGALQAILGRCARRELVKKKNKVFEPQRDNLDALNYAATRAEALRQHEALVGKLQAFVQERYGTRWTADEAGGNLLGFLQEGSVPVLVAATDGDPLPAGRTQSRKTKHIVSAFAGHLMEDDPAGFRCLETVVKGHTLSGVLFYPNLGELGTRFDKLDVYCDTPFLLRALGYSEEGLHLQCVDLVELLADLGAHLKCFHHTREEVVGVLEAEASRSRGAGLGATDYSTSRSFRIDEIEEMVITIDATLGDLGIDVVDTPTFTAEPDEVALGEVLKERINYARDRAREKDVQSLAAVARLRDNRPVDKFEAAKAIFVTTNTTLAAASSSYFRTIEGRGKIPVCMPVEMMTRLAWVKKPLSAPNLPRHVVMAASYAALNPPLKLWRKYLEEIERRRTKGELSDEEYHVLRSSREAREALLDETFGDEQTFSAGTLEEVLAHARQSIQAEVRAEAETERAQRHVAEGIAAEERGKREAIVRAHREDVRRFSLKWGGVAGWVTAGVVGVLIVFGLLATILGLPLGKLHGAARIVVWVCLSAFFLVCLVGAVYRGISIFDLKRWTSQKVEGRLRERGLRKLAEIHGN